MTRLLVVTAVDAERAAVCGSRPVAAGEVAGVPVFRMSTAAGLLDVARVGVGPVAAALTTSVLLHNVDYDLVVAAGIGGGFLGVPVGAVVVADAVVQADLGAELADGSFCSLTELGWGEVDVPVDGALAVALSRRTAGALGAVLSVSTVTGTQERADQLLARHPRALAEAMEGAGAGLAAARAGVRFAELRAISNRVGPRDRDNWQIPEALAALTAAFDQILAEPFNRSELAG